MFCQLINTLWKGFTLSMDNHFNTPSEIIELNMKASETKTTLPLGKMILLGITAGIDVYKRQVPHMRRFCLPVLRYFQSLPVRLPYLPLPDFQCIRSSQ